MACVHKSCNDVSSIQLRWRLLILTEPATSHTNLRDVCRFSICNTQHKTLYNNNTCLFFCLSVFPFDSDYLALFFFSTHEVMRVIHHAEKMCAVRRRRVEKGGKNYSRLADLGQQQQDNVSHPQRLCESVPNLGSYCTNERTKEWRKERAYRRLCLNSQVTQEHKMRGKTKKSKR